MSTLLTVFRLRNRIALVTVGRPWQSRKPTSLRGWLRDKGWLREKPSAHTGGFCICDSNKLRWRIFGGEKFRKLDADTMALRVKALAMQT